MLVQHCENGSHRLFQYREIPDNDEPYRFEVHFKVIVHQHVSHSGYRLPVDLGVLLFVWVADPLS